MKHIGQILVILAWTSGVLGEAGLETFPHWNDEHLAGTGGERLAYDTVPVFDSHDWEMPLYLEAVPGTQNQYLVLERYGRIWLLDAKAGTRSLYLSLMLDEKPKLNAMSGLTFHPGFPEEPYVYVHAHVHAGKESMNRVLRFEVDEREADRSSELVLLEWKSHGHNGGDLAFGPDGFLYITSGDGSTPGDPTNVGQSTDRHLSSILRIDVNGRDADRPYQLPKDNPYLNVSGVVPETWAYGFRNPWRLTFHPDNGSLWVGDNGDEDWEMVRKVGRGENHGWSAFEGSHVFRASNPLRGPNKMLTLPAVEHPHEEMRSVIGGVWYRGEAFPELKGKYIYGCYFTGKVWGFGLVDGKPDVAVRLADTGGQIVGFSEGHDGELLVVTMDKGLMKLAKADASQSNRAIPSLLSKTGLFRSTADHVVAAGLLPYEINAPMFWNGANRLRFMGLTGEGIHIQGRPPAMMHVELDSLRTLAGVDRWKMPPGALLMQTFLLDEERVETQVSYKDGGEWRFLTYRWRSDQSDADLVPADGEETRLADGRRWRFPARVDCAACHTHRSMFVPGINQGQLNRDFDYTGIGGKKGNQLETLHALGAFARNVKKLDLMEASVMPDPSDESFSLAERARSYLHLNCAHCHRETGLGGRADFQLLHWLDDEDLGVIDARPMVGLPGIDPSEARLVLPGDPDRSEMYRRMVTEVAGRMPLLGGETCSDVEGAELIRKWIESMDK